MDLAQLEQEYMTHVAGVAGAMKLPDSLLDVPQLINAEAPKGPAVSVWMEAAPNAHVDLRGLFDISDAAPHSVGSPVRSKLGLSIAAPDDAPASVGVSSPIIQAAAPDGVGDYRKKWAAPDVGFSQWEPH